MNIRVDLNTPIKDGVEVVFRSPVDCSQITGLIVYYKENGNTFSKEFAFSDAHGNNVGHIDHLFTENVVVKVILDVTHSMAFVQNADTNAYLEGRFADLEKKSAFVGTADTPFTDYYAAFRACRAVFHKVQDADRQRAYLASMVSNTYGSFYCVDGEGVIHYAVYAGGEWTYSTVEQENEVFVGDENTPLADFRQALLNKKPAVLTRQMGGSGRVQWIMYNASTSAAYFYHINNIGNIALGTLTADGNWTTSTVRIPKAEDITAEIKEATQGLVKSINGAGPDENGNVEIEVGAGGGGSSDGFSPIAKVTQTETGAEITITDKNGTTTATVKNGENGYTPVKSKDYFDGTPGKTAYQYAKDGGYTGTEAEFSAKLAKEYPTKVSELTNDKGYITGYTETDPTVPAWAKAASKPSYSKSEVGLGDVENVRQYSANNPPPYPVTKVNGKTGDVTLDAAAVGARPSTWTPTYSDVGAEKSGTAASAVSTHNTKTDAHNDIRLLITALTARLDALANSDDDTLDQMAEVVAYIKSNRNLIEQITTGKVSVSDIVNNLTTNVTNKPLSAAQGVALKALIDAISIPTKLSQLTNDKGFITGYTETDPTVPSWAKATSKPSYTKSEVGLGNVENVKQYSASNPPPYPVTSVNGKTGAVTLDASAVGARPSTWTPTAANVGAVPTSRKINGKALSADITLSASDVSAVPASSALTVTGVDADGATHTWTMYGVKN